MKDIYDIYIYVVFMDQQAVRGPGFFEMLSSVYKMYLYGSKKPSGEIERRTGPNISKEVSLISFWSGT